VSKLPWVPLDPKGQVIVVACPILRRDAEIKERWATRACAWLGDADTYVRDVVRDLLTNPQVRAIVFDGPACGRSSYDKFWTGVDGKDWPIDQEHQILVRTYVDLYDDDCYNHGPMQPFWPVRIHYL
jgi:hypothetical protein